MMQQAHRGFTLMEVLLVVGMMLLILAMTLPLTQHTTGTVSLEDSERVVLETLRTAESRALAGVNQSAHGVHVEDDALILFQGRTFEERNPAFDEQRRFSEGTIVDPLFDGNTVVFGMSTGDPSVTGTILLKEASTEKRRSVLVTPFGIVQGDS